MNLKNDDKADELFRLLFLKQCNALNEVLPVLFEKVSDYTELLLTISYTDKEGVVKDIDVTHLTENRVLIPVEEFEDGSVDITKCLLMDSIISLATGYYAIPENEMEELKKIMRDEPALYSTAYPFDNKVSLEMSGFVNSFLIRYPDWGDTMRLNEARTGSGGHPNDAMAAVLTLLDVPQISGKKVLELIRLSYELWVIFHSRMLVKSNGFDASSVMALTVPVLASVAFGDTPERTHVNTDYKRHTARHFRATLPIK